MFGLDEESKKVDSDKELQECFICNEPREKHFEMLAEEKAPKIEENSDEEEEKEELDDGVISSS